MKRRGRSRQMGQARVRMNRVRSQVKWKLEQDHLAQEKEAAKKKEAATKSINAVDITAGVVSMIFGDLAGA